MNERDFNLNLIQKEKRLETMDSDKGDVRMVLAYPNRYWIAMSNLGFQTVFKLFSKQARISVERAFIPESESPYLGVERAPGNLEGAVGTLL